MAPLDSFRRTRGIGVITPSGNTVVERVTIGILEAFPDVACHFSRTDVHGTSDPFPDSYDWDSMLGAARLLAHARPEVIVWSGSKAGSIAFALDRELCDRIARETGCRATTSTIALVEALQRRGVRRVALVTPYAAAYQSKVLATFRREGLACVADVCAGLSDNLSYAALPADAIRAMLRKAAAAKPDAIVAWCTNFLAAPLAAEIEDETGVTLLDSTALAAWHALVMLGIETAPAAGWGRLFEPI
jgi:maleate isomerase